MNARELLDTFEQHSNLRPDQRVLPPSPSGREFYVPRLFAALRGVLVEHVPISFGGAHGTFCKTCTSGPADSPCPAPWPCPTIRAITTALEASA